MHVFFCICCSTLPSCQLVIWDWNHLNHHVQPPMLTSLKVCMCIGLGWLVRMLLTVLEATGWTSNTWVLTQRYPCLNWVSHCRGGWIDPICIHETKSTTHNQVTPWLLLLRSWPGCWYYCWFWFGTCTCGLCRWLEQFWTCTMIHHRDQFLLVLLYRSRGPFVQRKTSHSAKPNSRT